MGIAQKNNAQLYEHNGLTPSPVYTVNVPLQCSWICL